MPRHESNDREDVVGMLKCLHAFPVENSVRQGTPDVAFIGGWIELKKIAGWPKRAGTIFNIPHYTREQRAFARLWADRGGHSFLLLHVGKSEWVLWKGEDAALLIGQKPTQEVLSYAVQHWTKGLNQQELIQVLRKHTGTPDGNHP